MNSDLEDFAVDSANSEVAERSSRLRNAVKAAGGNRVVAKRAGINLGTLNNYIAGRDMKASAMIAVAAACNISLDWLATGKETAAQPQSPAPPAAPAPLFQTVDMDRMGEAVDAAITTFQSHRRIPKGRPFAQIICILYDEATARLTNDE